MTITLTVAGRIATVDATTHVVAGNTYPVTLSLDSEWTGNLYLRVRFGSLYYDIPFASSAASVDVQMPVGYPEVGIGVFSEALEICTNEARVRLLRSILEAGEQVVEFDSDLYDQWAGEVTTLLTDDAFDAESTRPVQNAVLTAWKDTVPLDSALVHKTGTETVDGYKTFLQSPVVSRASPGLTLTTTRTPADTGEKFTINGFAGSELRGKVCQIRNASDEYIALRQYKVDGTSGYYDFRIRTDSSGNGWAEAPTFTADNNADTKIVTRAMLVATPTVVHTTGNETVAGEKTFTSLLTASNVQVKDASTPTVTMLKGSDEVASIASDGTQAGITASSQFFGLRGLGTAPFGQAPSYTADNSADAKIVTRSMLATTPTVVHTTGAETIAGNKTFSNTVHIRDLRRIRFSKTAAAGKWYCLYTMTRSGGGNTALIRVCEANNMLNNHVELAIRIGYDPNYHIQGSMTGVAQGMQIAVLRRTSNGSADVWVKSDNNGQIMADVLMARISFPTVMDDESDTKPAIGDVYDELVDVEMIA